MVQRLRLFSITQYRQLHQV
ncbi:unnamed protein product, partial [Rotaria sp. Silwood2]